MEKRVYYFTYENDYMVDLDDELCRVWEIDKKENSKILGDGKRDIYILNAEEKGIIFTLMTIKSYVYATYIFTNEKYEKDIERILEDLAAEIREDYGEDRRRFIRPIQNDPEFVKDYTDIINEFNVRDLFKEYL